MLGFSTFYEMLGTYLNIRFFSADGFQYLTVHVKPWANLKSKKMLIICSNKSNMLYTSAAQLLNLQKYCLHPKYRNIINSLNKVSFIDFFGCLDLGPMFQVRQFYGTFSMNQLGEKNFDKEWL